jgi:hypothetical protein
MARVRISKSVVDAAASDGLNEVVLWDERIAGFGLKVSPSGGKVYIYRYRMRARAPRPSRRPESTRSAVMGL